MFHWIFRKVVPPVDLVLNEVTCIGLPYTSAEKNKIRGNFSGDFNPYNWSFAAQFFFWKERHEILVELTTMAE